MNLRKTSVIDVDCSRHFIFVVSVFACIVWRGVITMILVHAYLESEASPTDHRGG